VASFSPPYTPETRSTVLSLPPPEITLRNILAKSDGFYQLNASWAPLEFSWTQFLFFKIFSSVGGEVCARFKVDGFTIPLRAQPHGSVRTGHFLTVIDKTLPYPTLPSLCLSIHSHCSTLSTRKAMKSLQSIRGRYANFTGSERPPCAL
jgi:hypothetical protein